MNQINQINKTNEINQIDQTNEIHCLRTASPHLTHGSHTIFRVMDMSTILQ
jgi:hypothetical protein